MMAEKSGALSTSRLSMIAEGTVLEGTLNAEGDVKISGYIVGTIASRARVMVSSSGVVEGEIQAVAATIAGEIHGDVDVADRLMLTGSACVDGTIEAGSFAVEEGALFTGSCRIVEGRALPERAAPPPRPAVSSPPAPQRKHALKQRPRPKKETRSPATMERQRAPSVATEKAETREGGVRRGGLAILSIAVVTVLATGVYYGFTNTRGGAGSSPDPTTDPLAQSEVVLEAPPVTAEDPTIGGVMPLSDAPEVAMPDAPILEDPVRQTAGLDRIAMEGARQRVLDRSSEPSVARLYQQAKAERVIGLDHADSGNFEQASQSFRAARALFLQMQQVLAEQDATLEQAATTDSVLVATTEVSEESLADSTGDAELAIAVPTPPDTVQEASADPVAESPAERGVEEATAALAEVQAAVRSLARELKLTIEREDVASMNALYYRGWGGFFEEAEAITAVVRPGEVQLNGKEATVRVSLDLSYRDAEDQSQQRTQADVWTLMQLGEVWVLRRVSSR